MPRTLSLALALSLAAGLTSSAGCGSSGRVGPDTGSGSSGSGSSGSGSSGSGSGSGSSSGSSSGSCATLPSTLRLTVSGFVTCSCFNGGFVLSAETSDPTEEVWSSTPITGCPGQTDPAYLKFSLDPTGLGITDESSDPGSGNSDYAPAESGTCSPFAYSGLGSQAGNITAFCPGTEDEQMTWSVTE